MMKQLLLIVSIVFFYSQINAQTLPVPPSGHPRIFARAQDIPAIKARFNSNADSLPALRDRLNAQLDLVSSGITPKGRYKEKITMACQANAFMYLIDKEQHMARGEKAKKLTLEYFSTLGSHLTGVVENGKQKEFSTNESRRIYFSIISAAMVYDWCYELFTATERDQLIADVNRLGSLIESDKLGGWPVKPEDLSAKFYVSNHWTEGKFPSMFIFSAACYDESPEMYDNLADHLYNHFVPMRNFYYQSGKHPLGTAYGLARLSWGTWSPKWACLTPTVRIMAPCTNTGYIQEGLTVIP